MIWIKVGEFSTEALFVFWDFAQVYGHMIHVRGDLRPVEAAQTGKIVLKGNVKDPMQMVLDAPMNADCRSEGVASSFVEEK